VCTEATAAAQEEGNEELVCSDGGRVVPFIARLLLSLSLFLLIASSSYPSTSSSTSTPSPRLLLSVASSETL
jgi:hypothetical protein